MSTTGDIEIARRLERLEARVWQDAVDAAPPDVREALGLSIAPVADGVALVTSKVHSVLYNRAFAFGLDAPIDERTIDEAIARYRRDAPFAIQPAPIAKPESIGAWLEARGLRRYIDGWVIWEREARAPIEKAPSQATDSDLVIEAVGPGSAGVWASIAVQIFVEEADLEPWMRHLVGRDRWTHYLAYDGDTPVGVGALYVEDDLAWLGFGGTLKSHRGRGGQSAMIERRIADAAAQGCRWLRVETAMDRPEKPNPSYRNVERAGFRVAYLRPSWAWAPAAVA